MAVTFFSKKKRSRKSKDKPLDDLMGFDERLPKGVEREIRVERTRLGKANPIVISDLTGKLICTCDEIKIEGESSLQHKILVYGCTKEGSVRLTTDASILITKNKGRV